MYPLKIANSLINLIFKVKHPGVNYTFELTWNYFSTLCKLPVSKRLKPINIFEIVLRNWHDFQNDSASLIYFCWLGYQAAFFFSNVGGLLLYVLINNLNFFQNQKYLISCLTTNNNALQQPGQKHISQVLTLFCTGWGAKCLFALFRLNSS